LLVICCAVAGCERAPPRHVLIYGPNTAAMRASEIPDPANLIPVLNNRLGRLGRARVERGDQVAVEIHRDLDASQLASVKRLIESLGVLEFRITAQAAPFTIAETTIVQNARVMPLGEKRLVLDGEQRAEWVTYSPEEFGQANTSDLRLVKRLVGSTPEALVLTDPWNVTGEFLRSVSKGADERGQSVINFAFNSAGAGRFQQLTAQNLPNPATGEMRYLGILLDKRLISAPSIRSMISDRGQISGSSMTEREINDIVAVLNSGELPYPIQLVSETSAQTAGNPAVIGGPVSPVLLTLAAGVIVLVVVACVILVIKLR
jgi:preprotein translocase subunit SecD